MIPYVLRRLAVLPVVVFLVTIILFSLMWRLPVELRASIYVPTTGRFLLPDEEAALVERAIRIYGLDRQWPVQYMSWLRHLVTGDWGHCAVWQQPVLEGLLQRAPATAELVLASMIPCIALALLLGGAAARYRRRLPDHVIRRGNVPRLGIPVVCAGPHSDQCVLCLAGMVSPRAPESLVWNHCPLRPVSELHRAAHSGCLAES